MIHFKWTWEQPKEMKNPIQLDRRTHQTDSFSPLIRSAGVRLAMIFEVVCWNRRRIKINLKCILNKNYFRLEALLLQASSTVRRSRSYWSGRLALFSSNAIWERDESAVDANRKAQGGCLLLDTFQSGRCSSWIELGCSTNFRCKSLKFRSFRHLLNVRFSSDKNR